MSGDILVAGSAVTDFIFRVGAFPSRPEKFAATDAEIVGGGCAANAAVAIARLGGHARLAARMARDLVGEMTISQIAAEGVDISGVCWSDTGKSAFSSIYIDPAGERQIVAFRGAGLAQTLSEDVIGTPSAVLADTRWPAAAEVVLTWARQRGVPGVLDGEAPVPQALITAASHVALSAQGLRDMTGTEDLEVGLRDVAGRTDAWVCVTDGAAGTTYLEGGEVRHEPAATVEVVDTLGAGDVWHGAFTLALAEGQPEATAVAFANAAASLKCTRTGGRAGTPNRAETLYFMQRMDE